MRDAHVELRLAQRAAQLHRAAGIAAADDARAARADRVDAALGQLL